MPHHRRGDEVVTIERVRVHRAVLVDVVRHQELKAPVAVEVSPGARKARACGAVEHAALHRAVAEVVERHALADVLRGRQGQGLRPRQLAEQEVRTSDQAVLRPRLAAQGVRRGLLEPQELAPLRAPRPHAVLAARGDQVQAAVAVHVPGRGQVVEPARIGHAARLVRGDLHRGRQARRVGGGFEHPDAAGGVRRHEEPIPDHERREAEDALV
mmetsp:Transcript_88724/g.271699  ORF Transcript_88724/g.271699 Transcript_88724/m.271699 type:complete len:213 (-) Transcript_88724:348-986(-)